MSSGARRWGLVLALLVGLSGPEAAAERNLWARVKLPGEGPARSIGTYTAGCVQGAAELPHDGPGYQVMRPSRRRYYGHPNLVAFVQRLAEKVQEKDQGPLLVGDLGQPKGGPSSHGHASHQSGLDVDIWFWHPRQAERRRLRRAERESLEAPRVVDPKKLRYTAYWNDEVPTMIWAAAAEPEVSRVLVNPFIKKHMCESNPERSALLRKIRPWYGHADHMHVRLRCPKDSKDCDEEQGPLPEGDGCDELSWWLDRKNKRDRKKGQKAYQSTVGAVPELPAKCDAMVERPRS